ncbi:MAG: PLP-dependent aminotransferase family protein [Acidobacteria bacterium]|nr:PLP-dependent aminotransferase family protein [Acidobacteriota bacterium]
MLPSSTQMVRRDGFSEFNFGQPDPDLLPVDEMRRAPAEAFTRFGTDPLAYGAPEGAWPLLGWLRDRLTAQEGIDLALDEMLGTGGNSEALDQICTLFTRPGDVVLVESPTYHLGLRILHDHALDLRPVPADDDGLRVDALEQALTQLAAEGRRARFLYSIPTFHNPTGVNLAMDRRRAVIDLAGQHDFLIVEDDVYRELAYDGPAPPSLFAMAPRGRVMRMGSFAKTLAPGVRLGFITCAADQARRIADGGLRDSGGSPSYAMGMFVAALCESGDYDRHVARLRDAYRTRRDALLAALETHLPAGCRFTRPGGGYFVWVTVPDHLDTNVLAERADEYRVSFIPGARLCADGGGQRALRLAFSLMKPDELTEGARRLGALIAGA